ncbi:dihydroxyacetone kinase phosphoryl donor subunit DhaM [Cellulomonas aerilata]|uniref:Phosphocarrier protein HPr n=1 Tax=Cellulomonas aerilata TaxID=515326 RepID=A0A512DBR6_9CELL|nr:dihydroxyacetone kinase phosphoryl donor subunit DhaM [Cellulomonas aerilata]GEO33924.1 hypothetical protein CAE01nite_16490 [Cellulomonas aerilata]
MAAPVVALVLVSHSSPLAQGLADVAAQMAPDVLILPAGGTGDGRIGTGFDLVEEALGRALEDGRSAVVLTDLGSAALTAESVLEMAEADVAARVRVVDAPFVEGAVEAAVVAQTGADLPTVARAAEDAATTFGRSASSLAAVADAGSQVVGGSGGAPGPVGEGETSGAAVATSAGDAGTVVDRGAASGAATGGTGVGPEPGAGGAAARGGSPSSTGGAGAEPRAGRAAGSAPAAAQHTSDGRPAGTPSARGTAVLRNRLGLHARPAAQLARTVGAFDALVTVNGVDARSVLALVGLGAVGGHEVVVAATGPQARTAVTAVIDELENGFGEA